MSTLQGIDKATAAVIGAVAFVLIGGYVVLAALRVDTVGYAVFVTGPVVSTIVGAVLARKVAVVKAVAEDVKQATNGLLSVRLDSLDTQLASASDERAAIAAGGPVPPPTAGPQHRSAGAR